MKLITFFQLDNVFISNASIANWWSQLITISFWKGCKDAKMIFEYNLWIITGLFALLKWQQHYLSLQTWHSPNIYDVWLWRYCGVPYSKTNCFKRDCSSQFFFVITGGKFKHHKYLENLNFEGTSNVVSISVFNITAGNTKI